MAERAVDECACWDVSCNPDARLLLDGGIIPVQLPAKLGRATFSTAARLLAVLQIQAFHRGKVQPLFDWVVGGVVHQPYKYASCVIDVKNVQAARVLLESREPL